MLAQLPALQMAIPSAGASHTFPQAPQFSGSAVVSIQFAPHALYPASQLMLHVDPVQTAVPCCGAGHALPQLPQCAAEVAVSMQAPLQLTVPLWHVSAQWPAEQTLPAAQLVWQLPQCAGSLLRAAQSRSHCVSFSPQLTPHAPAWQVRVPPPVVAQILPQPPQLSTSVRKSTHVSPQAA